MKLYLSSYEIGNHPDLLQNLIGKNKKTAMIPNALDFATDLERRSKSEGREIESLKELGLSVDRLDLKDYFEKEELLRKKISEYGLIWVIGGNTFLLRSAFEQSGFDNIIIEFSKDESKKDIVYGGFSAGCCVISRTLKGLELVDEPKTVKDIYKKKIIWEGLGLINYTFVPHYRSDHPESGQVEDVINYLEENKIPYKAVRDGEVLISDTLSKI